MTKRSRPKKGQDQVAPPPSAGQAVPTQSSADKVYRVTLGDKLACDCDDFQLRQQPCKHILAAQFVCAREHGGKAPEVKADAVPVRPTYKQNWPAYNEAQQTEKHRF